MVLKETLMDSRGGICYSFGVLCVRCNIYYQKYGDTSLLK